MPSWELINIDLKEQGLRQGGRKFMEFFFAKNRFLVRSLTIPFPSPVADTWLEGAWVTSPSSSVKGILRFPNELLINIVELCPDVFDKVCFALTCKRILALSREHIERYKETLAAPWAGGRLIYICELTGPNDLPRNLLTAPEVEARSVRNNRESWGNRYGGIGYKKTASLSMGVDSVNAKAVLARCSKPDRERVSNLCALYYPPRDDWVVCNLTKGVYIRATAVAKVARKPNDSAPLLPACAPDLGHAILYRICWSSHGIGPTHGFLERYRKNIARGDWAGHRFVITTMDRMPDVPKGRQGWEDITSDVVKDLHSIWDDYR